MNSTFYQEPTHSSIATPCRADNVPRHQGHCGLLCVPWYYSAATKHHLQPRPASHRPRDLTYTPNKTHFPRFLVSRAPESGSPGRTWTRNGTRQEDSRAAKSHTGIKRPTRPVPVVVTASIKRKSDHATPVIKPGCSHSIKPIIANDWPAPPMITRRLPAATTLPISLRPSFPLSTRLYPVPRVPCLEPEHCRQIRRTCPCPYVLGTMSSVPNSELFPRPSLPGFRFAFMHVGDLPVLRLFGPVFAADAALACQHLGFPCAQRRLSETAAVPSPQDMFASSPAAPR